MKNKETKTSPWIEALCSAVSREADKIPAGFLDIKAIAADIHRSERRTYAIVNQLIKSGGCEMRVFRVSVDGRLRPVRHYCLKRDIQLQ